MKIWSLSDLHLETVPYPDGFRPTTPDFDVLVCAGDTWSGNVSRGFAFLRALAGAKPVVAVLGNHEHWRGEVSATIETARRAAKVSDIHLLEREAIDLHGVRFIGATLWSDYKFSGEVDLAQLTGEEIWVRDRDGERPFSVKDARELHHAARKRVEELIGRETPLPRIVVTHHAPLIECIAPPDREKWIAGNCASDLSALTDSGVLNLWIHGHVHHSIDLRRPGGTRVVCNPAGTMFSNTLFDEGLVLPVGA